MIYAIDQNNNKIVANKGIVARCPECKEKVIPKCGEIKEWHFSHIAESNCCSNEPETDWHIGWKKRFPSDMCEVIINRENKTRRADFYDSEEDLAIEFQHSHITISEIEDRSKHYKNIIWIFDCIEKHCDSYAHNNKPYHVVHLKWANKSWLLSKRKILFHMSNDYLFNPKVCYPDSNRMFGVYLDVDRFVSSYKEYHKILFDNYPKQNINK